MNRQVNKIITDAPNYPKKNHGVVLFVSLIILIILTIIGLSAMNNSHVELQTASNAQEINIANQAAQAGLNAVMCLADENSSGSSDNNPLNKTYVKIDTDNSIPGLKFNWDWDRSYNSQNISPFTDDSGNAFTLANCSIVSGSLSIGTGVSNDLDVAVRRTSDTASLRSINGNSYKELECQNFVIDSRYDFPTSGAKAYVWAGVCKEKIDN
jgi:type II secretory pathway pseudopilin PulG